MKTPLVLAFGRHVACLVLGGLFFAGPAGAGTVFVHRNSGWRITDWTFHPGRTAPPAGWNTAEFDDAAWNVSKGPFGHGMPARLGRKLDDMRGNYTSIYLRTRFLVGDRAQLTHLLLDVNYTGGYVAWINGVRVAGRNAPSHPGHEATATANRVTSPGDFESILLAEPRTFLRPGENVLAIQAFSSGRDAAEFHFDAGLVDTRNLAHNKPAFASSVGSGRNKDAQFFRPFNAVDGTQMTFFTTDAGSPQWFYVDLGRSHEIDKVRYHWWGDRQPRDFKVQISDDAETWREVHSATDMPKAVRTEIEFRPHPARYVRILGEKLRVDTAGMPIAQCEVFAAGTPFELSEFHSLASGGKVTASSENRACSFCSPAVMATNGHALSWWHSAASDSEWLAVDLGSVQPINRVRLFEGENNKSYTLQISTDGVAWQNLSGTRSEINVQGGDVKRIVDLRLPADIPARHVRFHGTERNNPAHGYTIFEILILRDERPADF